MTASKQLKPCFAAILPMWRRTSVAVATVVASTTAARADVAAIHAKGRFPTSEVD